jgi:hypothetical protein
MHRQICLPVTIEIQRSHRHSTSHRLFEDAGRDWFAVPQHKQRQPYIDRNDFHKKPWMEMFLGPNSLRARLV